MHLVIFDIDGTLVHTHDQEADCFIAALKNVTGISHVSKDLLTYQHVTDTGIAMECIEKSFARKATPHELDKIQEDFTVRFTNILPQSPVTAIQGAQNAFSKLAKNNIAVAIATGSYTQSAHLKLASAQLTIKAPIASCNDNHQRISIMEIALMKAKQAYQREFFDSITYIGDAPWDVKATHALKWHFIAVASHYSKSDLQKMGAHYIIDDYHDELFTHYLEQNLFTDK